MNKHRGDGMGPNKSLLCFFSVEVLQLNIWGLVVRRCMFIGSHKSHLP